MAKQQSIAQARTNLPQLVRDAEKGEAIELTRRGKSVAVLLGRDQYERLAAREQLFTEAWSEFRRDVDLGELNLDPREIFGDTRDRRPGRESDL